ncbi:hypothetical protein BH11BAC7_BH11BAC7_11450 [soil metagenome]
MRNKRPILFSSIAATIFTLLYAKLSSIVVLNRVQEKFTNGLLKFNASSTDFLNNSDALYLWELQKLQFYIFLSSIFIISLVLTALLWKKGNNYKSTGLYFIVFSLLTLMNGYFYAGFKGPSLFMFIVFTILFLVGFFRKLPKLSFVSGLLMACSILVNLYCYFIGFAITINQ